MSSDAWDEGPSLLASLWRYRLLLLAGVFVGAFAGYGLSLRQPPQYDALASIQLSGPQQSAVPGAGNAPAMDPDRHLRNEAQYMTSSRVVTRAAELSGVPAATWRSTLVVTPAKEQDLIVIHVRASTGTAAAKIANSVVVAYQQVRSKQANKQIVAARERLRETTDKLRAELADLDAKLQGPGANDPVLRAQRESTEGYLKRILDEGVPATIMTRPASSLIEVTEKAFPPTQPVEPRPRRSAAAGALFGLFAVSALAWLLDRRRVQAAPPPSAAETAGPDQPAPSSLPGDDVPVLGAIPNFVELGVEGPVPTVTAPQSVPAKSYHAIAQLLQFAIKEAGLGVVVVTSPEPGDGKTTTTLNLAIAAGQNDQGMLVVDADLRRRNLSELCQINGRVGLSDMVDDNRDMNSGHYIWLVEFPGLQVIPGGSHVRDASSIFTAPSFGAVISTIRAHECPALIDSPALSEGPEALEIAKHVDAAVVVVSPRTPLGVLRATRQRLDLIGVPVLGYVINGETSPGQVKPHVNGVFPFRRHGVRPTTDAASN
jgi:tyrosine-protein kinase